MLLPYTADKEDAGESEASPSDQRDAPPFSTESAKATLVLNMAAAYCVNDDADQAATCLAQLRHLPRGTHQSMQCTLLSVFVALRRGRNDDALAVLQQHSRPVGSTA